MGLLDSLLQSSGGGGLLDSLLYPSPLSQAPTYSPYAMNGVGYDGQFDPRAMVSNPFGAASQAAPPVTPQSVFASGATPVGIMPNGPMPGQPPMLPPQQAPMPPPMQPQQPIAPTPQMPQASAAPQEPGPINNMNIGGYQMPQFGTVAQYTPQAGPSAGPSTDISAQSRQPAPPEALPPALGGTSYLERLNNGGGLIGSALGDTTQQRNLKAQYDALRQTLVDGGETPKAASSKAMLAVLNPEAGKTIMTEALTNKADLKMVKDGFGGEHPMVWDPIAHTLVPPTGSPQGAALQGPQETFDNIAKARDAGASPEQLYAMAPAQLREGVKAMIEGRAVPTNLASRGDARNNALMLAHAIDPTFDETQIPARVAGVKAFYGGGKYAEIMRKANQAPLHLGELVSDKMAELPGTPMPALNAGINLVNSQLLGKGAAGNFEANSHAVADELSTMFKGAGISDTEIRAWEKNLSPNMSVEQQRGMAKTLLGLYRDGITALEKTRQESVGPVIAAQKGPILGPQAEAALAKIEKFGNGGERSNTTKSGVSWSVVKP